MRVLLIHPYRECIHKFYKEHMFMPERAVQICTFLDDQGWDVDFKDFGATTLEDDRNFTVPLPDELKGTGRTYRHYGASKNDVDMWLNENLHHYDAVIVDSLMPYFNEGVEQVAAHVSEREIPLAFYGEWVALRPEDFQDNIGITGNYEVGLDVWLTAHSQGKDPEKYMGMGTGIGRVHDFPHGNVPGYENDTMNDLPAPEWTEWVDMTEYPEPHRADYRASRGCPEDCDFCHVYAVHDRMFKFKDSEVVIEDLKFLIEEQGFEKIQLRDDNFNSFHQNAEKVFRWLANEHPEVEILQVEGMEMKTAAKANSLIKQIGRCNYDSVRVGFETAVEGQFNKNALEWWERAYENFTEVAGFDPDEIICWVLAGHPQLDRTDEMDSAIYLSQYGVRLIPSSYREVPGTELYNEGDPYLQGQMRPYDDDHIQRSKTLYRTVSHWNVFGYDLFREDNFWESIEELSWVDSLEVDGARVEIRGTVSGWTRTEAIEEGFAIRLAMDGYHKSKVVENTNDVMVIEGMKGNDEYNKMLMDRLQEKEIEVADTGGLL